MLRSDYIFQYLIFVTKNSHRSVWIKFTIQVSKLNFYLFVKHFNLNPIVTVVTKINKFGTEVIINFSKNFVQVCGVQLIKF